MATTAQRRTPGKANFHAANQRRVATAAVFSAANVRSALDRLQAGGVSLPPQLGEAARLRVSNPALPLSSLAAMTSGPCTKDTLAGRLRRVITAAARIPGDCPGCVGRGTGSLCCACGGEIPEDLRRSPQDPPEYTTSCADCRTGTRHTHAAAR